MNPSFPTRSEIDSAFGSYHIFEVRHSVPTDLYTFPDGSLDSLDTFMSQMSISAVFLEYIFIDRETLRIKDHMFGDLSLDIIGGVQFDSHRFNRDLESIDLSSPVELRIFALYEGKAFGLIYVDDELDSLRRISPESRVEQFAEERRAKLKERTIMSARKEDPQVERFCDVLMLDRLYRELKNDNDRFNYVIKVARRPGNDNLKKTVLKDDGSGFSTERVRAVVALTLKKMDVSKDTPVQMVFIKN